VIGRRGFLTLGVALSAVTCSRRTLAANPVPKITLTIPRLADNGHSVPLEVSVDSPMTAADHVKSITLISDRNPRPLMAKFNFNPMSGRAHVITRVRLNGSQKVTAIADLSSGETITAVAEVEVTESACLDAS
jgi:sulfur-oxidizing protein SoxY